MTTTYRRWAGHTDRGYWWQEVSRQTKLATSYSKGIYTAHSLTCLPLVVTTALVVYSFSCLDMLMRQALRHYHLRSCDVAALLCRWISLIWSRFSNAIRRRTRVFLSLALFFIYHPQRLVFINLLIWGRKYINYALDHVQFIYLVAQYEDEVNPSGMD